MEILRESIYKGKLMAGPMVRGSTLPFRVSCLDYGADVVFSPGMVDLAVLSSKIVQEGEKIMLIKEENAHNKCIFETIPQEKGKLIFQLVTSDGPTANQALEIIGNIPAGIDINCGCPEDFATHRGCGSKMTLEKISDVVKTVTRVSNLPVSVKFRIKENIEESIQFAKIVENSGASAIILHGRHVKQKHKGSVHYTEMKLVFDSVNIFKIGNGGIKNLKDANQMKEETGCHSVMICKEALHNPSVFSINPISSFDIFSHLLNISRKFEIPFYAAKYSFQQILNGSRIFSTDQNIEMNEAKTYDEVEKVLLKVDMKKRKK